MAIETEGNAFLKAAEDAGQLLLAFVLSGCVWKSDGVWRLGFAILLLAAVVGSISSILRNVKVIRSFYVLLECFATCLAPLCFVFGTFDTLEGIHNPADREKLFLFNLCVSLPAFAFARKPRPMESLWIIEAALLSVVGCCGLAVYYVPAQGISAEAASTRVDQANRLLLGALLWTTRWVPELVTSRLARVSTHTKCGIIMLDYVSKASACVVFATPYLPPNMDLIGLATGRAVIP